MQSAATFPAKVPTYSIVHRSAQKVYTLCMAYRGTYKWNSENLKNVPESCHIQDSGTFLRFEKFHL
jgi:hypothetical protein